MKPSQNGFDRILSLCGVSDLFFRKSTPPLQGDVGAEKAP